MRFFVSVYIILYIERIRRFNVCERECGKNAQIKSDFAEKSFEIFLIKIILFQFHARTDDRLCISNCAARLLNSFNL